MNPSESETDASVDPGQITSEGYRITAGDDADSFFALCIEESGSETAWIMSDTVHELGGMR